MVSAKATVQKVLDNLPDDCTMDQVMERIRFIALIESRLDELDQPGTKTYTTEEVLEHIQSLGHSPPNQS